MPATKSKPKTPKSKLNVSAKKPLTKSVKKSVSKPLTKPLTKSVKKPITKPITKPVTKPITKPLTKPVKKPISTVPSSNKTKWNNAMKQWKQENSKWLFSQKKGGRTITTRKSRKM